MPKAFCGNLECADSSARMPRGQYHLRKRMDHKAFTRTNPPAPTHRMKSGDRSPHSKLPTNVNLPTVHNFLTVQHVIVGVLRRGQTRMIRQNSHARPNLQTIKSVLVFHKYPTVLLRHLAD